MKLLRALIGALFLALLLLLAGTATIVWLALDSAPTVDDTRALSPETASRALKQLSRQNPRRMKAGSEQTLTLRGDELDALVHEASRQLRFARASTRLSDGVVDLSLSQPLPLGRWINVGARVARGDDGRPSLQALSVGNLEVPAPLARWLIGKAAGKVLPRLGIPLDPRRFMDTVRSFDVTADRLAITYTWQPALWEEGARALLPPGEHERLGIYHEKLLTIVVAMIHDGERDLMQALAPLFALAVERSRTGDAVAEQRSALLALSLFVNGRTPGDLLPEARDWLRAPPLALTLNGRDDLAQHFVGSAVLALFAGTQWADALGLSKEMSDARGGSGFSFTDLLADRAGTRLGEQIASGRGNVAARLAGGLTDRDVLPPIEGLAEFIPEAEFRRRYGGVGEPAYQAVIDDIEARLASLELYQ